MLGPQGGVVFDGVGVLVPLCVAVSDGESVPEGESEPVDEGVSEAVVVVEGDPVPVGDAVREGVVESVREVLPVSERLGELLAEAPLVRLAVLVPVPEGEADGIRAEGELLGLGATHEEEPGAELKGGVQGVHDDAPAAAKWFAGHCWGAEDASRHMCPAGHAVGI